MAAPLLAMMVGGCDGGGRADANTSALGVATDSSPEVRARQVLAQMTLAEKLTLIHGDGFCWPAGTDGWTAGVPRLGIPPTTYVGAGSGVTDVCLRDKLRPFNPAIPPGPATELPAPIARAASWSKAVANDAGKLLGRETRDKGYNVHIGGDVNLARDPRNGRTFEQFGEDPLLAGTLVVAEQRAVAEEGVINSVKHYVGNEAEAHRNESTSEIDERTLRELYLVPFEMAIRQGRVGTVMCSYNAVNGVAACENRYLLRQVLKGEWGFEGWVMSDWFATYSTVASANNGLDQEQPWGLFFGIPLALALGTGEVPLARVDDMVFRILRTMFASRVVDDPPVQRPIDTARGAGVARQIEEQGAVLLKNAGDHLPLDPAATASIAVIGAYADGADDGRNACPFKDDWCNTKGYAAGGGSSSVHPTVTVTPLAGIRARVPHARVEYASGRDIVEAARLARSSEIAIVFARDTESEGKDRVNLSLDEDADSLIEAVSRANPRTIVVLETGGPVTMPWLDHVPAVLEAWYPGQSAGAAIARLLFGDVSPSGRLPVTFPKSEADLPTAGSVAQWPGVLEQQGGRYRIDYAEGVFMGYRWYDERKIEPLFPFGYGLTYGAKFEYSDLRIESKGPSVMVQFRLRNGGTRTAVEVSQLYLGMPSPSPSVHQPPKWLRGFDRIELAAGEAREVSIELPERAFSYWDVEQKGWAVSPGCYEVMVGSSSRDVALRTGLSRGTLASCP
ncbi:glycoside hydrolase family 3 C-terminal domain-containing protein [Pendulispora rubella]|uniref:Glycoside hydrolase family 3 C-terminal domain-containing protein n=1 Tax=Pendulispora rubella TaxID=2741070 RepID=A0ABZ2L639_9BACT